MVQRLAVNINTSIRIHKVIRAHFINFALDIKFLKKKSSRITGEAPVYLKIVFLIAQERRSAIDEQRVVFQGPDQALLIGSENGVRNGRESLAEVTVVLTRRLLCKTRLKRG